MPSITSITPATFDAGRSVTLSGSGFGASQGQVLIGGVAQNVNTWSDEEITFTTVRGSQSLGACRVDVVGASGASGGTAALGWSAPSGLGNGNALTISTDGTYSFGTKSQAAPVLWDMGADVYVNGSVNTVHAGLSDDAAIPVGVGDVWSGNTDTKITTSRSQRHAQISRHYYTGGPRCFVERPRGFNESGTNTDLFLSMWVRYSMDPHRTRRVGVVSKTGTFTTGASGEWGEAITVTIGAGSYSGRIYSIDATYCQLAVFGISLTSGTGSLSIVGDSSGATASLTTTTGYQALSSTKLYRVAQAPDDGLLSILQIANKQFWVESNISGADSIGMARGTYAPAFADSANYPLWQQVETHWSWTANTVAAVTRVDGETKTIPPQAANNVLANTMILYAIGSDASVVHEGVWFDMGEIYLDTTPQRVVIGNASTWSACTHRELQRPTAWSGLSVSVSLYQGSFTSIAGNYLYIINASGSPVTASGVAL